ncbi:MerR family regulatory protein [Corynebacterium uterequi]|uniref:MerR family regulatory protein n=2 Tax=Corynebacterium uterequi TaxID=1072256 RepID=A0A0G3HCL2_9CORY|nr:MerR family regulatory protein [Corynebacterium uterequi]
MSIGKALERLTPEFPDITVSKIRYLETEGLITPQRTASGYRRYTDGDVERLRYILIEQRDNYLPLKVIREHLEAMENGELAVLSVVPEPSAVATPALPPTSAARLTMGDIADRIGRDIDEVAELVDAHLLVPDDAGLFTADDVAVASASLTLTDQGFAMSNLKRLLTASQRQADMIAQVAAPAGTSGTYTSRAQALETSRQLSTQVVALHAALLAQAIRAEFER